MPNDLSSGATQLHHLGIARAASLIERRRLSPVELTQALLRAGKPYRLVLLPGTHMLADPVLRAAETEATEGFLRGNIGIK